MGGDFLCSLTNGRTEDPHDMVQTNLLDEDVTTALVLGDDVSVSVPHSRDALLARDEDRVLLRPIPLLIELDDVEPLDGELGSALPAHDTRSLSERTVEADGDVGHDALGASARVLIDVRDRRAVVVA